MKKYKVLFADLDGTLIDTVSGEDFPQGVWDMKIKFDVLNAIKNLGPDYLFIVSNQCGIESGFVDERAFGYKLDYLCVALREYCDGIVVKGAYCPKCDESDPCRKPNVGLLERFHLYYRAPKDGCLMIGDSSGKEGQWGSTDKDTAANFGIDYMDVEDFVAQYNAK